MRGLGMAKDGKFGMFGGVFTPSLLTILGVIMYLRLPWVVGNSGLYVGLAVILIAHVVSVATGLSISSIATDKKVGAGGPYYIISRSFGLAIGGAIGLALFLGLSFSISLYVIGFSESLLPTLGLEPTANNIRIAGTATIIGITVITFISTSLAIRMQYVILVLIAVSLAAVFLGSGTAEAPLLDAPAGGASFPVLFGIFFPAVTGFTAGVNMSGDLRDPKRAIPKGTMLAIGTGMAVYVGLAVFLAVRVDADTLRNDPLVLQHIAVWGPLVIAGVWGATLSSALGSILGAPRILQAMSRDRITPRAFAKGFGPTQEPRTALLLAFAIGEAGILIAELDVIARVVSMVFLSMYAAVNVTCVIESWASPDFRPTFRIPRVIGIVGAVSCLLLMVQLDVVAMLGAVFVMLATFAVLKRRQLSLESGDTWEGVWASLVRLGLHRLHRVNEQQRNWRPNILLFDEHDHPRHEAIRGFATSLITGNGIATDFRLTDKRVAGEDRAEPPPREASTGLFDQTLVTPSPFETIRQLSQFHGFSGLAPNTLLLPWRWHRGNAEEFFASLRTAARGGLNLLLFEGAHEEPDARAPRTIDVWWWPKGGSLSLSVALVRFMTRSAGWERAQIRFLIVGTGLDDDDQLLRARATQYIAEARLDATVRVIPAPSGGGHPDELVLTNSRDASMCLIGLPRDLEQADVSLLERLDAIAGLPGGVVFLRPNKAFAKILQVAERVERARTPTPGTLELPALDLAEIGHPDLERTATGLHKQVAGVVTRWHERFVTRGYQWQATLCDQARALIEQRYDTLLAAADEPNLARRRAQANRGTSKFLAGARTCAQELGGGNLDAQCLQLAEELTALLEDDALLPEGAPDVFEITRPRSAFAPDPDDPPALRRWKAGRRWRTFYRRTIAQRIDLRTFARYYHRTFGHAVGQSAVRQFQRDSYELAVELGQVLSVADRLAVAHLNRQHTAQASELDVAGLLAQARDATLAKVDALRERAIDRIEDSRRVLTKRTAEVMHAMSADFARLDLADLIRRERRPRPAGDRAALLAEPERWKARMEALFARVVLAVRIAAVRHQLAVSSVRTLEQLAAGITTQSLQLCTQLRDQLVARRDGGGDAPVAGGVPAEPSFDGAPAIERFANAVAPMTAELPEAETTLADAVVLALAQGDVAELETASVNVRSGVQTLVETHLISPLELEVSKVGELQSSAWTVVRDTVRVLAAHVEDDADADADAEVDADGTAADRVAGTLSYSIERVEAEIARLREFVARLDAAVMTGLETLSESTGLLSLSGALSGAQHKRQSRTPSRIAAAARRARARARDLAARAMYRRSRGRARIDGPEQLRAVVARARVDAEVARRLPRYYEHLFMGALNINEAFFVGRQRELELGRKVLAQAAAGQPRVVLVSGDRGSGKTALCRQLTSSLKTPSVWVSPGPDADGSAASFRAAFAAAVGWRGSPAQVAATMAPGTTVVIDELDGWWERRPDGLAAVDEIVALVRAAPAGVGFVIAGSDAVVRLLDHLRPLSRLASAHLRCEPLSAQQIRDVVMLRHTSTGLRMRLGNTDEDSLTEWSLARLFHAHYEYSKGNVASSLRAWVSHVHDVSNDVLHVRRPAVDDWDVLGVLRAELVGVLVELLLHRHAGVDKLQRITNMSTGEVLDCVAELRGFGLVSEPRRGVFHMAPQVHRPVGDWLRRGGLM